MSTQQLEAKAVFSNLTPVSQVARGKIPLELYYFITCSYSDYERSYSEYEQSEKIKKGRF